MDRVLYIIIIFFISLTVISCAKKSGGDSSTSTTTNYSTSCINESSDDYSKILSVILSGNNYEYKYSGHYGLNCIDLGWEYSYNYTYTETGTKTAYTGESTTKFDLIVSSVKYTPKNSTEQLWANQNEYCGFTNWLIDNTKDISGLTCSVSSTSTTTFFSAGDSRITNWYIYSDGQYLKLGDYSNNASVDSNGFANYLESTVYQRQ
jgi:hypothetical protein